MKGLARSPALHFLALGALVFALRGSDGEVRPSIVITAADVASLRRAFAAEHGVPPTRDAEAELIDAAIAEQVLLREAHARGLDRADRVVQDRLARLGEFLGDADVEGLTDADVVIRRHLVETMRVLLARAGPDERPGPADVAAYVARHRDRFVEPERVRLTHAHLSARRGAALEADASRLLAELRRDVVAPAAAIRRGDPFLGAAELSAASRDDLDRLFGPGFGAAVGAVPPETWAGPIASSYGLHLVWIHERTPERLVGAEEAERRVRLLTRREGDEARLRERLQLLRARYDVRVE